MVKYLIGSVVILALTHAVLGDIACYNCWEYENLDAVKTLLPKMSARNSKSGRIPLPEIPLCSNEVQNYTCLTDEGYDRCVKMEISIDSFAIAMKGTLRTCGNIDYCENFEEGILNETNPNINKDEFRINCYTCNTENNCNLKDCDGPVGGSIDCYNCIEETGDLGEMKDLVQKILPITMSKSRRTPPVVPSCANEIENLQNYTCLKIDGFDRCIKIDVSVEGQDGRVSVRTCGSIDSCKKFEEQFLSTIGGNKDDIRITCYSCNEEKNCNLGDTC